MTGQVQDDRAQVSCRTCFSTQALSVARQRASRSRAAVGLEFMKPRSKFLRHIRLFGRFSHLQAALGPGDR